MRRFLAVVVLVPSIVSAEWRVSTVTSKVDDTVTAHITTIALREFRRFPSRQVRSTLTIRCHGGAVAQAFFHSGGPANVERGINGATVTVRLDRQPAVNVLVRPSSSDDSLFLPDAARLAVAMSDASRLLVRFVPFKSQPAEIEFDVSGLGAALAKAGAVCGS